MYRNLDLQKVYEELDSQKTQSASDSAIIAERYLVRYKKTSEPDFNQLEVSDNQFLQAFRYLQVDDKVVEEGFKQLLATGLGEKNIRQIFSIVMKHDHPEKFFNALSDQMSLDEFLNTQNIIQHVTSKYELDPNLVFDLLEYQPNTMPITGKAESFIMMFVRGAKKGKIGDIEVDGKKLEVKGSGARIKGQKGFGNQTSAARAFGRKLQELANKAKLEIDPSGVNYDITIGSDGGLNEIAPALMLTGKVSYNDIVDLYFTGFHEVYQNTKPEVLKSWISKSLNPNGTIKPEFQRNYFIFALQYYASQEDFDYLLAIGTNPLPRIYFGKMSWITRDNILSNKNILNKIAPASWPSFRSSAGAQGGFFSIKPVVVKQESE